MVRSAISSQLADGLGPELGMMLPMLSGMISKAILQSHYSHQTSIEQGNDRGDTGDGAGGREAWLQSVPAEERSHWQCTIAQDSARMKKEAEEAQAWAHAPRRAQNGAVRTQRALSDAYLSGSDQKRRKLVGSGPTRAMAVAAQVGEQEMKSEQKQGEQAVPVVQGRAAVDLEQQLALSLRRAITSVEGPSAAAVVPTPAAAATLARAYRAQLADDITVRVCEDPDYDKQRFPHTAEIKNTLQKKS
jgi:hypothetical protein